MNQIAQQANRAGITSFWKRFNMSCLKTLASTVIGGPTMTSITPSWTRFVSYFDYLKQIWTGQSSAFSRHFFFPKIPFFRCFPMKVKYKRRKWKVSIPTLILKILTLLTSVSLLLPVGFRSTHWHTDNLVHCIRYHCREVWHST